MHTHAAHNPLLLLKLLAHDLRWGLVIALAHSDLRVQELAARVARPLNLVSYHLRLLREAGLVQEHRSSADRRDIYCSLDLARLAQGYRAAGLALHPLLAGTPAPTTTPARVLFLCTHNSARSQMAEGILRVQGAPRPLTVASAGNHPATLHPGAIAAAAGLGVDIRGQQSKHLDLFRGESFDYVITVCDQVREECPVFGGDATLLHWSIPDPAAVEGDEPTRAAVFAATAHNLAQRIEHFLARMDDEAARRATEPDNRISTRRPL